MVQSGRVKPHPDEGGVEFLFIFFILFSPARQQICCLETESDGVTSWQTALFAKLTPLPRGALRLPAEERKTTHEAAPTLGMLLASR